MWRTLDGYRITMPRFRMRRLERRVRTRFTNDPRGRAIERTLRLLFGRARRSGPLHSERRGRAVFATLLGRQPLVIVTRVTAPGTVEVVTIRRAAVR